MAPIDPLPYTVIAVDIENYSGRDGLGHVDLRRTLRALLEEASEAAGIDRLQWHRQDQGDGELALIPADVPKPRVVADLVRELGIALQLHNRSRNPYGRIRLRAAVHHGEVLVDGDGFAGEAPIVVCRLLNARQLRSALTEHPDVDLALIVSDRMHQVVVGHRGLVSAQFQRVHVAEKSFADRAWIHVPEYPAAGPSSLDDADPPPTEDPRLPHEEPETIRMQTAGSSVQIGGNARVKGPVAGGTQINLGRS